MPNKLAPIVFIAWLCDKEECLFVFPAMCWKKSYVLLNIWKAGDNTSNIIESVHADANLEGVHCSLLRGIFKGQHLDNMKLSSMTVSAWIF